MTSSKSIRIGLISVALLVFGPPATRANDVTLDTIHAAWRKRQDAVKSARFEWAETHTVPKGLHGEEGQKKYPPDDVQYDHHRRLTLDGNMLRLEWRGMQWNNEKKKFVDQTYWSAADGRTSKSFFETHTEPLSDGPYPIGLIHKKSDNPDLVGGFPGKVLLFCVRPLDPNMGCTGKLKAILSPTSPPVVTASQRDGRTYSLIQERFGDYARSIWVDAARDFVIVRYAVAMKGREFEVDEVVYDEDRTIGWVPRSWRSTGWNQGAGGTWKFRSLRNASMVNYEINPTVDNAVFRPSFPPGTMVTDYRTDEEYLVKSDGTSRPILPLEREREVSYEEIVATESGRAGLYRSPSIAKYYWWIVGGILTSLSVAIWRYRSHFK